jgi:O-antigen biosynthesis protein
MRVGAASCPPGPAACRGGAAGSLAYAHRMGPTEAAGPRPGRVRFALAAVLATTVLGGTGWWAFHRHGVGLSAAQDLVPPPSSDLAAVDPAIARAVEAARSSVAEEPREAARWKRLALVLQANQLHEDAVEAYLRSAALDPGDPQVWYWVSLAQARLERADEAIAAMRRAATGAPGYAPAHWRLALYELERGEVEAAERAARAAVAADGGDFFAQLALARVQMQQERYDLAVDTLETLRNAVPASTEVRFLLGTCYQRLDRPEEAARHLRLGRATAPSWTDPWFREMRSHATGLKVELAAAMEAVARSDPEALARLERLRREQPDDLEVLVATIVAVRKEGRFDDALALVVRALELQPSHPLAHLQAAGIWREKARNGPSEEAPARLERAAGHGRRAVELAPALPVAHAVLGDVLRSQGDSAAAEASYLDAVRLAPHEEHWLRLAATFLVEQERWERAVEVLEDLAEVGPRDPWALLTLGRVLVVVGRTEEALRPLARARELGVEEAAIRRALGEAR